MQRDMARLRLFMSCLYEKKVLSSSEDQERLLRYADSTGLATRKVGQMNGTKMVICLLVSDLKL